MEHNISNKKKSDAQRIIISDPYNKSKVSQNVELFQKIKFVEILKVGICLSDDFITGTKSLSYEHFRHSVYAKV